MVILLKTHKKDKGFLGLNLTQFFSETQHFEEPLLH